MPSQNSTTVIRGTGVTAILTVVSRILGFVRDLLVARLFGAGAVADAFFVAYRIPNLLRSFVAEGALTAAFVPVFSTELEKGNDHARRAIREVSGFLLVVTTLLTIAGILFSGHIVALFAPGFEASPEKGALCAQLTAVMFPYIICISLIALVNGALNSVHIYGASGLAQVVMNIVLIIGAVIAGVLHDERSAALILSISVLAGGVAQIFAQIPALRRAGFSILPASGIFSGVVREVVRLMLPATIGAGIYQCGIFLNTLFASFLAGGSVSWLFYADRITQLPIGIFTIALASVLLPVLSRARASNNQVEFSNSLVNALRYTSFVIIPVAVFLYIFAEPLVIILFQRGAFSMVDSARTAAAVQALLIGVWGVSCHSMVTRAFIARKDTVTPTMLGGLVLVLNAWISLTLMGPVVSAAPGAMDKIVTTAQNALTIPALRGAFGHVGLAFGSSLSTTVAFLVLGTIALRRFTGLEPRPFLRATFRSAACAAIMVAAVESLHLTALGTRMQLIERLVLGSIVALVSYSIPAWLMRSPELKETFVLIPRLVRKATSFVRG